MQEESDAQLLSAYVAEGAESAFEELVARHTGLVYSAAARQVASTAAVEVTQEVFIGLARNAAKLSRSLDANASLAGWLCRSARNLALNARRNEFRRTSRERHAMQIMDSDSDGAPDWIVLRPALDSAMAELNEADYEALVLRYFKNQGLREVGRALGVSDDTAQKRVARALDKLYGILSKRGVTTSVVSLSALLSAHAVQGVPNGLIKTITSNALLAGNTTGSNAAVLKGLIMTTTQKTFIALGVLTLVGIATLTLAPRSPTKEEVVDSKRLAPSNESKKKTDKTVFVARAGVSRTDAAGSTTNAKLADDLRAAIRNVPASRVGTRSYPPENVIKALLAFGANRSQAFSVIQAELNDPDVEIRKRAISTLGHLGVVSTPNLVEIGIVGDPAPEAKPLLWKMLLDNEPDFASLALSGLRMIGFEADEIPALTSLLSQTKDEELRRYLPEAIARTIQRDAGGSIPFLGEIESLLDSQDPALRFSAACALAQHEGSENPKILESLMHGLKSSSVTTQVMALETLQRLGSGAKPALQALLDFGDTTDDAGLKELAFKTMGSIDREVRAVVPEVDQSLTQQEKVNRIQEKLASGNYARQDLLDALKEPTLSVMAAQKLAELGASAKDAVPNLLSALAGKDQTARDRIVQAIHQIDPDTPIHKVDSKTIAAAATAASLESQDASSGGANRLEQLLEKSRMMNSEWQTQQELLALLRAIRAESPEAYRTFCGKLVEIDPMLGSLVSKVGEFH